MTYTTMTDKALQRWLDVRVGGTAMAARVKSKDEKDYKQYIDMLSGGSPEEVGFMLWQLWHEEGTNKSLANVRDQVRAMFETTTMTDRERGMWVVMQQMMFTSSVQERTIRELRSAAIAQRLTEIIDKLSGDD